MNCFHCMHKITKIVSLITLFILGEALSGIAISQNMGGIQVSFTKTDSEYSIDDYASNVLRIVNMSNREQPLNVMIAPPAGWLLLGSPQKEVVVNAKDSVFIPVRLKPRGDIKGDMTYVTNAYVLAGGFTVGSAVWNISIKKRSEWHVKTSLNRVYFTEKNDSATFYLNITNSGNSDESLIINAHPEDGILIKEKREALASLSKKIHLKPGQDTLIFLTAILGANPTLPTDYQENQGYQEQIYRMGLSVENENKTGASRGSWRGRVNFIKLPNKIKVEKSSFASFPLTIELNSYNILTDNTYATLGLYGHHSIDENRSLSYYYQGSFIKNQLEWRSYLGNYFYVGYFSKVFDVEVGDVTAGRSGSRLVGKGLRARARSGKNHEVGGVYIGNPSPFNNPILRGGGVSYRYRASKLIADVYYENTNNILYLYRSSFVTGDISYKLSPKHSFMVGGGYSLLNYDTLTVKKYSGYRGMVGYTGNVKKFNINLNARYNSPFYAPRRGNTTMNATVAHSIDATTRLRGGGSFYHNQPSMILSDGTVIDTMYTGRNLFFLQLSHVKDRNNYFFQPEYSMYTSSVLDVNTGGASFEYRMRSQKKLSFYTSVFAGYSSFPSHQFVDPIFVSNIRLSFRYKNFNSNLRYYYGPFYLNEQFYYVNTLMNPQRLYAMMYYQYWFARNHMSLNTNVNYNYMTMFKRHQVVIRPELFYYSKGRFRFSFYTSYMLFANGEYERVNTTPGPAPVWPGDNNIVKADAFSRFEVGFGIKFDINVPAGKRKNYNAVMVVFRDANGNGIKDNNEQGYANMLIRVTKTDESFNEEDAFVQAKDIYELITDNEGMVEYSHLPRGNYKIETISLSNVDGWFGNRVMYRLIEGNQTIPIPLSKGAKLSGGIFVERDEYSNNKPINLGGIRVTAVNELTSETYSSLTDGSGNYTMYLPDGDYVVSINEGAVGSRYHFTNNNIPVSIKSGGKNYSVGFYLAEKKRKIIFGNGNN